MKDQDNFSRRGFLRAGGLAASAFWLQLSAAKQSVAEQLQQSCDATKTDFGDFHRQYTLGEGVTYLNHASIGTMPKDLQGAFRRYLEVCESNPWLHIWGDAWVETLGETRSLAAEMLGCDPSEVTFSHNTTETFNLLAAGLPLGPGDEVLFGSLNHSGASVCWSHHSQRRGYTVRRFEFPALEVQGMTEDDVVSLYRRAIGEKTRALVLPHVDNVVGLRHPVRKIADAARGLGVEFVLVDAAQTIGMLPVDVRELGADVVATSTHKWLQAPKGSGIAFVAQGVQEKIHPLLATWGQKLWHDSARRFEDYGTRDLPTVLTLGDAVRFRNVLGVDRITSHHRCLWQHAYQRVESEPGLVWHSPSTWQQGAAIYAVGLPGKKSSEVFKRLFEQHGFVFRPFESHGLSSVRISPNTLNTTDELDALFDLLAAETAES